jgi:CBS domain-containing protein
MALERGAGRRMAVDEVAGSDAAANETAGNRTNGSVRTAADLMRRHFIALSPEDSLLEAERTMRLAGVRALPVLANGRLLGIADHREVLRALLRRLVGDPGGTVANALRALRVDALAISAPISVSPETPLEHAAARLCDLHSGCLAVVEAAPEGDRMLGLLTEDDLLRAAFRRRR